MKNNNKTVYECAECRGGARIDMKETFSPIKDYENRYVVSNLGTVLSLNYNGTRKIKKMKWLYGSNGYKHVQLCKKGKIKNKHIHRLLAETFISNPENKPQVNHIDENYHNNDLSNLEWVTAKENVNHGTATKRRSKKIMIKIKQMTMNGKLIKIWDSATTAGRNGYSQSKIVDALKNRREYYRGSKWSYYEE